MRFLLQLFLLLYTVGASDAFDRPIAKQTTGALYPHILHNDVYELNARNVKSIQWIDRQVWIGTSLGVIRYDANSQADYEIYDNTNVLLSNGIFNILRDPNGRPWVGTYGGGLSYQDKGVWRNINTPQGLCDAFVYDVEFNKDQIWIATWSGANRVIGDPFERNSWESFTKENTQGGLIDDWVYAIEIAKNGAVWFGTESGVSSFDGRRWKSWNHDNGLSAPFSQVSKDNVGMTGYLQGSHHTQGSEDIPNTSNQTYRPNYVVSMRMDEKGRLWIGSWGGGLTMLDTETETLRTFTVQDGLPGNYILEIKEGPDNRLWIGTNAGLSRFDGSQFTNFSRTNGLKGDYIFSLEFGDDHSIWVGSHYSVSRFWRHPDGDKLLNLE